jgi:hypothetical protein
MKKILLLLLLFCAALTFEANAQIRYGAKLGGTLSSITLKAGGTKVDEFKAGVGLQFGGVLEYSFSESFALQPELMYVFSNSKMKTSANLFGFEDGTPDVKWAFQSIQLPINLKYKMGVENLKFYVTAGPYLGYLVSGKLKAEASGISGSIDLFESETTGDSGFKRFDFGLGAGFGVEVSKFAVGVGYQYGIANLISASDGSFKLGTFNLSVGYFF